jgi:hypothetical protein
LNKDDIVSIIPAIAGGVLNWKQQSFQYNPETY